MSQGEGFALWLSFRFHLFSKRFVRFEGLRTEGDTSLKTVKPSEANNVGDVGLKVNLIQTLIGPWNGRIMS